MCIRDRDAGPDAEALGLAMAVAQRTNNPQLIRETNALATTARPRRTKDAARLLGWFSSTEVAEAEAFIANANSWNVDHSDHPLELIRTETEIRGAGDPTAQRAKAVEVGLRSREGLRSATRVLGGLKGWDELRRLWTTHDLETLRIVPRKTANALAEQAARAGWLEAAQVITGRTIEAAGDEKARRTHARVSDQIHIARTGWPVEETREPSYEPRPGAVSYTHLTLRTKRIV